MCACVPWASCVGRRAWVRPRLAEALGAVCSAAFGRLSLHLPRGHPRTGRDVNPGQGSRGRQSRAPWGFSSVQLLSVSKLSATPWTAASQASLSITQLPGVYGSTDAAGREPGRQLSPDRDAGAPSEPLLPRP